MGILTAIGSASGFDLSEPHCSGWHSHKQDICITMPDSIIYNDCFGAYDMLVIVSDSWLSSRGSNTSGGFRLTIPNYLQRTVTTSTASEEYGP